MERTQAGFTLIELVMVIAILGILAATALPKFVDLNSDARKSLVHAAKGSLSSVSAMAHSKWLVNPSLSDFTAEGIKVAFEGNNKSGYPKASDELAQVAGLTPADYDFKADGTTLTVSPKNAVDASKCNVVYTEPTAQNTPPSIAEITSGC